MLSQHNLVGGPKPGQAQGRSCLEARDGAFYLGPRVGEDEVTGSFQLGGDNSMITSRPKEGGD